MVKTRLLVAMVVVGLLGSLAAQTVAAQSGSLDFSDTPFVSFQPVPPLPEEISHYPVPDGSDDYWNLWADDAPWADVAEQIDAFHMHAWMLRYSATDEQLRELFAWLDERDMPLGLEVEPLTWRGADVCDHRESMEGPYDLMEIERVHRLGGRLDYLTLDQPFANGHVYGGPGACEYTVEEVVDEVWSWVRDVRRLFPGIPVGSIEPVVSHLPVSEADFATWLDTWEARTGEPFAFLNIDVDWRIEDWPERVLAVEAIADARNIPFGLLYLGSEFSRQNDQWLQQQMQHVVTYEEEHGGTPEMTGMWSWHSQPDRILPDDDLDTSTGRVNQYFGERTSLTKPTVEGKTAVGRLTALDGEPLAGLELSIAAVPVDGGRSRHRTSGIVPAGAREALIGVRANIEGGVPGPLDVRVSEVSYRENGGRNKVPNARFRSGLDGWGSSGTGKVSVVGGKGDKAMRVKAKPKQSINTDGQRFKVKPGAEYDFAATLDVPVMSAGTGYVAVIFLGAGEVRRDILDFAAGPTKLPVVTTDEDGAYRVPLGDLSPGRYDLQLTYEGDIDHRPARAEKRIRVK